MDRLIQKYIALIKSKTSVFKAIYVGDPMKIPASRMPALVITRQGSSTQAVTNGEDQRNVTLQFTVVVDVRPDIQDDKLPVPGYGTIYDIVEGCGQDMKLKASSLLGIIRGNLDIDSANQVWTDVSGPTRIQYATY